MSRHGKHHPDKMILGGFVTPEEKARVMIVAEHFGKDVSRFLMDCVDVQATKAGIMENGKIKSEYEERIRERAHSLRVKKTARQKRVI